MALWLYGSKLLGYQSHFYDLSMLKPETMTSLRFELETFDLAVGVEITALS
jgi:hypothetical protein